MGRLLCTREWQLQYLSLCVYLCVKLSNLKSLAQSATACELFENPSKPCSVDQKDCRLSRITAHVVMGVNWMWQGVAYEFQFGLGS